METQRCYERLPPAPAEALLEQVLDFRHSYDRYGRPDDVQFLLSLFPTVTLRDGFILDYVCDSSAATAQRIVAFARPLKATGAASPAVSPEHLDPAVVLYPYLEYDPSPQGVFEYVFFVTELAATRASWHATEWLACTPVFTRERYARIVQAAARQGQVTWPEWYGPEASFQPGGGYARFMVHTEMAWERIYYLQVGVDAAGRLDPQAGQVVADLGLGTLF